MIEYRIDRARRIVEATATGNPTGADFLAYLAKLKADPDFDPTFAELADCSAASASALSPAVLRQLAEAVVFHPSAPRAIVVSDDMTAAVALLFTKYTESTTGGRMRHFLDMDSAAQWLAAEQQKPG